ncbi:hypothetical protein [Paenarthrobacter aurescens]|uniref:hypothetical protein n=1 Tax=Paenarthrobacter aurescens TaxID=43663 RepID=UPI003D2F1716
MSRASNPSASPKSSTAEGPGSLLATTNIEKQQQRPDGREFRPSDEACTSTRRYPIPPCLRRRNYPGSNDPSRRRPPRRREARIAYLGLPDPARGETSTPDRRFRVFIHDVEGAPPPKLPDGVRGLLKL